MVIAKACRLGMLLFGLALIVGCARTVTLPNGGEVPKDEYRASQQEAHAIAVAEKLRGMIQDCPADMTEKEASECRWSNAMTMVVMPQIAAKLTPSGYWQYRQAKRQFWLDVAELALNNPFTKAFASGGSDGGGSFTVKADGESRIDNLDVTMGAGSPFITGNDNATAVKDGQNQLGDGVQGQVNNKTNDQRGVETEGGPVSNAPEGVGIEGSL